MIWIKKNSMLDDFAITFFFKKPWTDNLRIYFKKFESGEVILKGDLSFEAIFLNLRLAIESRSSRCFDF
jgi:hypothetical protein